MATKTTCVFLTIAAAAIAAPSPARTRPGFGGQAAQAPSPAEPPSLDEKRAIEKKMTELASRVEALAARKADRSLLADVDIYRKAAEYILRFPEEFGAKASTANTLSVLDTGLTRARELEAGAPTWPTRKGHVVRAYVSRVDGSVQPYGVTIPESYDGTKPVRLDIWQHGTDRALNEVAFIIQQERERPIPLEQDYIQVEPLGRTNVSYRWAGEADMFESLASVQRRYNIDPKRIVLRGFSMGGASSWHLSTPFHKFCDVFGHRDTETRRRGLASMGRPAKRADCRDRIEPMHERMATSSGVRASGRFRSHASRSDAHRRRHALWLGGVVGLASM